MIVAPALREIAQTRWDVDRDPAVVWDDAGQLFELVDPEDDSQRVRLAAFDVPVTDPVEVGSALAEGLAACDLPPTADGVGPERAALTLRAAGIAETPSRAT